MANKKLTQEELDTIKSIQEKTNAVVSELGSLELTQLQLDARKAEIKKYYEDVKSEEGTLGKELSEKYGNGTIDLEKGEFVPSEA